MRGLPCGQEPYPGQHALLQLAIGEEVQCYGVSVFAQAGLALQLGGGGQAAQAVHLVAHLGGGDLGRPPQLSSSPPRYSCAAVSAASSALPASARRRLASMGRVRAARRRASSSAVSIASLRLTSCCAIKAPMAGSISVAERRGRMGVMRPENALVEHGALREVGYLGRAADVRRGGQDRVLKDGA